MNQESLLEENLVLSPPTANEPQLPPSSDSEFQTPTSPRKWIWLAIIILLIIIVAGGFWYLNRDRPISSVLLNDPVAELNLAGLNQPQKMAGACASSYTVHGLGLDEAGRLHYSLSIVLIGDPQNDAQLAQLLATDACAAIFKTINDVLTDKLKLAVTGGLTDLVTTSFVTKTGRRLFLP